jgi:hypothetical protein
MMQCLVDADQRPEPRMARLQRHAVARGANALETVDRDVDGEVDEGHEPESWRHRQNQHQRNCKVYEAMGEQRQRPAGLLVLADRHPGILQHEVRNDVLCGEQEHPAYQRTNRDRRRQGGKQQI